MSLTTTRSAQAVMTVRDQMVTVDEEWPANNFEGLQASEQV